MKPPYLDNDIARCVGKTLAPGPLWHPDCVNCLRRTAHNDNYSVFMHVPADQWTDNRCPYRIAP